MGEPKEVFPRYPATRSSFGGHQGPLPSLHPKQLGRCDGFEPPLGGLAVAGVRRSDGDITPLRRGALEPLKRQVFFLSKMSVHDVVTPYSMMYGVHPSFFDFDRKGRMQLTD